MSGAARSSPLWTAAPSTTAHITRWRSTRQRKPASPARQNRRWPGGNDAGAIHVSRGGVRTVAVSLPCRYLHSAVSLISQKDFHEAETLIERLAEKIAGGE